MKVMIQNSAIKGNREFHVRPHKDLEMITLMLLCKIIDLQKKKQFDTKLSYQRQSRNSSKVT